MNYEELRKREREEGKLRNESLFSSIITDGHDCVENFNNEYSRDYQQKEIFNRCYGMNPMILSLWFGGQDGCESYLDDWTEVKVSYCPFCGKKADE